MALGALPEAEGGEGVVVCDGVATTGGDEGSVSGELCWQP